VGIFSSGIYSPMIDPDVLLMVFFLTLVIALLLMPPGPGTPLKCPIK
jgi:hypothetical protein